MKQFFINNKIWYESQYPNMQTAWRVLASEFMKIKLARCVHHINLHNHEDYHRIRKVSRKNSSTISKEKSVIFAKSKDLHQKYHNRVL